MNNTQSPQEAGSVGRIDRIIRLLLAVVLVGFAAACPFSRELGALVVWGSGVLGLVFLITAVMGRCPLYRLIGIRT